MENASYYDYLEVGNTVLFSLSTYNKIQLTLLLAPYITQVSKGRPIISLENLCIY
jgi:hypothetical protein